MSTNYFAYGPFPGGEPDTEGLHIGQSAAGWRFLFHAHPTLGLTTVHAWELLLREKATLMVTEYGTPLTADQMTSTMKATIGPDGTPLRQRFHRDDEHRYVTPEGDSFCRRDFF